MSVFEYVSFFSLFSSLLSCRVLSCLVLSCDVMWCDVVCVITAAWNEISKGLVSGGRMVARLKVEGIDGKASPGVELTT